MYDSNGCTEQDIRRKYQIDRVHFYKIISRKEEYLSQYAKAPIKNSVNAEVNNRVWDWYVESKANNIAVNGPLIQNQARQIAKQLGYDGFRASNGWLQCFKMRHNIRFTGPPAHKRDPQPHLLASSKEMSDLMQTPHWPIADSHQPETRTNSNLPNIGECETIEIVESDGEEGSMEGGDVDEDEGNDIQDEISFEDEVISEKKYDPPLREEVNSARDDICRNYQDVLDCIHRLQCFSVSTGDNKLLEMSTEMRNHVERTIYGIGNSL